MNEQLSPSQHTHQEKKVGINPSEDIAEGSLERLSAIERSVQEVQPDATEQEWAIAMDIVVADAIDTAEQSGNNEAVEAALATGIMEVVTNEVFGVNAVDDTARELNEASVDDLAIVLKQIEEGLGEQGPAVVNNALGALDELHHDGSDVSIVGGSERNLGKPGWEQFERVEDSPEEAKRKIAMAVITIGALEQRRRLKIEVEDSSYGATLAMPKIKLEDRKLRDLSRSIFARNRVIVKQLIAVETAMVELGLNASYEAVDAVNVAIDSYIREGFIDAGGGKARSAQEQKTFLAALDVLQSQLVSLQKEQGDPSQEDMLRTVKFAASVISEGKVPLSKLDMIYREQGSGPFGEGIDIESSDNFVRRTIANTMVVEAAKSAGSEDYSMRYMFDESYADMSDVDIADKGLPIKETVHYLRDIAIGVGMERAVINDAIAENLSADHADFQVLSEELLSDCDTDQEKCAMLMKITESFLSNGSDERVGVFADTYSIRTDKPRRLRFTSNYDYINYTPQNMTRFTEQTLFLMGKIGEIGESDLVIEQYENVETLRRLAGLNYVNRLEQYLMSREDVLDISAGELDRVADALTGLPDVDRIESLSIIAQAYGRVGDVPENIRRALGLHTDFVTHTNNVGYIIEDQLETLGQLDASLAVEEIPGRQMILALLAGDIGAQSIVDLTANEDNSVINPEDATRKLFEKVPRSKIAIGEMLQYRQLALSKQAAYLEDTRRISTSNVIAFHRWSMSHYKDTFGLDKGIDLIEQEVERIQNDIGVSVNLSAEVLQAILFEPPYRLKAQSEVGIRSASYRVMRDGEEQSMGIRRQSRLLADSQPIYGGVTSPNGRDEYLGAAPGGYGNLFIELNTNRIADRTVVVPRDSFYSATRDLRIAFSDAAEVVAVNNLVDSRYAEAQIMGGVTVSDIASICIDEQFAQRNGDMLQRVRDNYPDIVIRITNPHHAARKKRSVRSDVIDV